MRVFDIWVLERAGLCHCVCTDKIKFVDNKDEWDVHSLTRHLEQDKGMSVTIEECSGYTTDLGNVIELGDRT